MRIQKFQWRVKNQTVKITIVPMNLWICKHCSFENLEGIICGACSQYKEPEPQQQQYNQSQYIPPYYPPQSYRPPSLQQPPFISPQHISQFGMIPPQMPPYQGQFGFGHPPRHMFGGFHHHFKHHNHHIKWHKLREILKDPQFKQQKEKLQQLLKEMDNKKYHGKLIVIVLLLQWNWSDLDEQRATRLAEVLQCYQEQAREYLMIFRDLTLNEIVMMVEKAE
ncbi:unnamed protein product [Paramecium sonneborni]|uniref:Uncharacterized protein n=1 Tax=Paramecium sonneborni TaxID=65129 RepID=A0A8S1RLD4_9CILI|nr:unnamed protein product [Paramecium sonneborni]